MSKNLPIRGCAHCFRDFRPKRAWQQFCSESCRRLATKEQLQAEYTCSYCGLVADTVDHVPPTSIRPVLVDLGLADQYPFQVVRACRECNSALSDHAYWTLEQRRAYIVKWIERRYRKYLSIPEWTKQQLVELEPTLRQEVTHGLVVKAVTLQRLSIARGDDSSLQVLHMLQEVGVARTNFQLCQVCRKRTGDPEGVCSDTCGYVIRGVPKGLDKYTRRREWKKLRIVLKKLTRAERRRFKILRFRSRHG